MSKREYTGPEVRQYEYLIHLREIESDGFLRTRISMDPEDIPELIRRLQAFAPKPDLGQLLVDNYNRIDPRCECRRCVAATTSATTRRKVKKAGRK